MLLSSTCALAAALLVSGLAGGADALSARETTYSPLRSGESCVVTQGDKAADGSYKLALGDCKSDAAVGFAYGMNELIRMHLHTVRV